MKKTSRIGSATSNPRRWQRNGLAAASLMALASMAMGQSASLGITYGTSSTSATAIAVGGGSPWGYTNALGVTQDASSAATNTPSSLTMGINQTGSGTSAASITQQVIQTLTRVNVLTPPVLSGKTIDLALINTGDNNLGYGAQSSSGTITSVSGSDVFNSQSMTANLTTALVELSQSGYASSLRSLSNNQISSVAQANTSSLIASGTLSGTYSSTTDGAATATYGSAGVATSSVAGSAALNAVQGANNIGALAAITGGKVQMVIAKSSNDLSDGLTQSGNRISAITGGNTSTNLFQASSSSAGWTGSAVVTNAQGAARNGGNTSEYLSTLTNVAVLTNIKEANGSAPNDATVLSGSLAQNSNTIDSTVVVNNSGARANNGSISGAGNVIQFDSSAAVTGGGTNARVSTGASSSTLAADLAVLNVQNASALSLTASAAKGAGDLQIAVAADQLASGGSITQNGNLITARAVPNLAGNVVSVGQTSQASAMTASASAVNLQQTSGSTSVQGLLTNAEITVEVGSTATTPTNNGAATSSNNIVSALADANLAATSVAANAANMSVSGSLNWASGSPVKGVTIGLPGGTGANTVVSNVGVTAINQQSSDTSVVKASNTMGLVQLTTGTGTGSTKVAVENFNGTLTGNTVSSAAAANTGSTGVTLNGASAPSLTAAVGNSQWTTVTDNKTVTAVAGSTTGLDILDISLQTGNATSSRLVTTSNVIESTANANKASNALSTDFSTQMTGKSGTDGLSPDLSVAISGLSLSALGDLTVANAQYTSSASTLDTAKLSATTVGGIQLNAAVVSGAGSSLNLSSNRISANAGLNQANNSATVNAADASGIGAGVVSDQVVVSAWTEAIATGSSVSSLTSSLSATNASVNQNTVSAAANANSANNTLTSSTNTITGRSLTLAAGLDGTTSPAVATTKLQAVADLGLVNNQTTSNTKVYAAVTTAASSEAVNVTTGAIAAATNLTVNQNTLAANAESNTANNRLISASSASSTDSTALVSRQVINNTTANSSAANLSDQVLVSTGTVADSNVQINANKVQTSALGNYAANTQTLSGMALTRSTPATLAIDSTIGKVTADNALVNLQSSTLNSVDADTLGKVTLSSGALSSSSSLALTANQLNATAQLNYADNRQALNYSSALTGATQGLLSKQEATNGSATADLSTGSVQTITVASVNASNAQVSRNTADVSAGLNTVFNVIDLSSANMTTPKSLLNNNQAINIRATSPTDTVAAALTDTISLDVTGTVTTGVLNVVGNATRAQALGNMASNTISLAGSQVTGSATGGASSATGATNTANLGTINVQSATGGLAYTATNTSTITATAGGNVLTNSRLALNDNLASSAVQVNTVTNQQSAALSTGLVTSPMGIASSQTAATGATVTATTTAVQKIDLAANLTASNMEVTGNRSAATASVNLATNTIQVGGATAGSGTLITGSGLTTSLAATVATPSVSTTADVGIANYQSSADKTPSSVLRTEIGIEAVEVAGTGTGASAVYSQLSVTNNTASSVAQANAATNTIGLTATTMGNMTGAVANAQTATTNVSASLDRISAINGVLRMDLGGTGAGTVSGVNALIGGNTLAATASMNDANNVLSVSGTTLLAKGTTLSSLPTLEATTMANMDFGVLNVQSGTAISAGVSATLDPGNSVIYAKALGNATLPTFLTARDNSLTAQGVVNNASNTLSLTASGDLRASGVLKNVQTAASNVSATLGGSSAGTKAMFGIEADQVVANSTTTYSMDNNMFRAQAGVNNATNVLNAVGGTSVAGSGTSGTTSANNFAILNYQDAGAGSVTAKVQYLNVGADLSATASGGNVNVAMTGNQIVALAYGNLVSSTVGMKTLAQGLETTGVTVNNKQTSTATLSAQIVGVNMAVTTSGSGSVGGTVAMSGNSITSQVVANQASVGMVAR